MTRVLMTAMLAVAASLTVASGGAVAQTYPDKPIKWVVPFPPGAGTDALARVLGEHLSKKIGHPVIIENKPGASGMIGAQQVATAAPDGATLLMHTPAWPATKVFVKAPNLTIPDGLAPISLLAEGRLALTVSAATPVTTFKDFIDYGIANPDKINAASTGPGDILLNMETMKAATGLKWTMVTYRGAAPALVALLANEVQVGMQPEFAASTHAKAGKLKILAVTGDKRSKLNPDVPTFGELGYPKVRNNWFAAFAPPGTPQVLLDRISADLVGLLALPEVAKRLADVTLEPVGSTSAQLRQHIATTIAEYEATAKAANIQPE